ncbi:PilZ domain-containing protein [uncultured Clostridium sp.]|uniref:flagellar brake protein n=1 Tax=uncultured Clostridium sp. TaxID=59620 RepID=UPI0028E9EF12|nr:PilZ domain-containing protein [uncultured Clostridium sp.]
MTDNIKFSVNSKIEILMDDGIYKSDIQDISDSYAGISIPVREGVYLPLKKGELINGVYYTHKGVYKFTTVVTGRKIDRIMMVLIDHPKKFVKIQRRNFVRVSIVSKACCSVIDTGRDVEFFDGYTLDVSAGGMKLSTYKELYVGNILAVSLLLKDEEIHVKGKVIRVEKENKKNICGVSFIDVDDKTVEKIIRVLFQIMREHRKNGPGGY